MKRMPQVMRRVLVAVLLVVMCSLVASCLPSPPAPASHATVIEEFEVRAPSGNMIYGLIRRPDPAFLIDEAFPAVILVPGGTSAGRQNVYLPDAQALSESGMVVVAFDAEGRIDSRAPDDVRSEGIEDFNGFRHQDGLARIVEMVAALDYVLVDNIGLWSSSYGITMAAGCVARYPDLPVKYLVDGEGPSDSFVTTSGPRYLAGETMPDKAPGVLAGHRATWEDDSPENLAWWSEREAAAFIGEFRGEYLRLQASWDHAQPPDDASEVQAFHHPHGWPGGGPSWWQNKHATDMVNAAVAGGVPWVRINLPEQGNEVNAMYDAEILPVFLPGRLRGSSWGVQTVLEMAARPALGRASTETQDSAHGSAPEHQLLFGMGIHIEPYGATVSSLAGGGSTRWTSDTRLNYHRGANFENHVADLRLLAGIVERHGGQLTVQAQTPFTTLDADSSTKLLAELERRGHEIALHFHEDAHLGEEPEFLPSKTWCAVMDEQIELICEAGVEGPIRHWTGGYYFEDLLEAASCAHLEIVSNHSDRETHKSDPSLFGLHPWRPAAGPTAGDVSAFARHNPQGAIIYLPQGLHEVGNCSVEGIEEASEDERRFMLISAFLCHSLEQLDPDRVNVFHFTVHAGEYHGDPQDPFAVIERFLSEVVDPLVASGRVRWATFSEMADEYEAWERKNPGVAPRGSASSGAVAQTAVEPLADGACGCNAEMELVFAANIAHPTQPCHRDDASGCDLWKATLDWEASSAGLSDCLMVTDLVLLTPDTLARKTEFFPDLLLNEDETAIAAIAYNEFDHSGRGYYEDRNRIVILDGRNPAIDLARIEHARFPDFNRAGDRIAYQSIVGRKSDIAILTIDATFSVQGPGVTVSQDASICQGGAQDPQFMPQDDAYLVYHCGDGKVSPPGVDPNTLMVVDVVPGAGLAYERRVHFDPSHADHDECFRCGHLAFSESGKYAICSDQVAVYVFPVSTRDGERWFNVNDGRASADSALVNMPADYYRTLYPGLFPATCDQATHVYAEFGNTDTHVLYTVMCKQGEAMKSAKLWMALVDPAHPVPGGRLSDPDLVNISGLIEEYVWLHRVELGLDAALHQRTQVKELHFMTGDFFVRSKL